MEFNQYQNDVEQYDTHPQDNIIPTLGLGLCSEAGEVAGKLHKIIRDKNNHFIDNRMEVLREMGDVLWYLSTIAKELNINLDYVAQLNIDKLESRKQRGVLQGEGDNR